MNNPYVFKKCIKCGEWKVACKFNFKRWKKGQYELADTCKACNKEVKKVQEFNRHVRERCKLKKEIGEITTEQYREMIRFFKNSDAYSGEYISNSSEISLDHIEPLSKNGLNEIWNIIPCSIKNNSNKQSEDLLDWYMKQRFYSRKRLNKIMEWQRYAYNKYHEQVELSFEE